MFKALALFGFFVFLLLSSALGSLSAGPVFFISVILVFLIGLAALFGFTVPTGFLNGAWASLQQPLPESGSQLGVEINAVAAVIRQDGLLALESKRKDIRDQNLRYLLKRIMDGFEAKDLVPFIRNQREKRESVIDFAESTLSRFTGMVTSVGLVMSLILISDILASAHRPDTLVGIAQVFSPFAISLVLQMILEAYLGRILNEKREEGRTYFLVLEDGLVGIQQGLNPDLLRDRIRAHTQPSPKWIET